jgi:hypothetical protein
VWALRRWKDAAARLFGLFLSPRRWKERLLNLGMGLMGSLALASSALLLTRVGGRGLASRLRPAGGLEDAHFLIQIQAGLAGVAVPILLLILERMGEDEILPISRALIRRTLAFPLIFYALGGLAALLCLPEPPFALFTVLLTCLGLLFAYGRAAVAARDPDALREEALELLRRDGQRQNQYAVQARLERIAQEGRRAAQEGAWRRVEEALKAWKSLACGLAEQLERDLNRAYGRHEREKRLSRAAESGRLIARALDPLAPALARLREEPELLEGLLDLPEEFLAQRLDRPGEGLARWAAGLQVMVRLYPRLPPDARRRAAEEWAHAMSYEEGLWSGRDPDRIALLVWAAAGLGAAALLEEDEDAWSFLELLAQGGGVERGAAALHLAARALEAALDFLRPSERRRRIWEGLSSGGRLARAAAGAPFSEIARTAQERQTWLRLWIPSRERIGRAFPEESLLQMALAWGLAVREPEDPQAEGLDDELIRDWICPGIARWRHAWERSGLSGMVSEAERLLETAERIGEKLACRGGRKGGSDADSGDRRAQFPVV